jgi:hypothetical protein
MMGSSSQDGSSKMYMKNQIRILTLIAILEDSSPQMWEVLIGYTQNILHRIFKLVAVHSINLSSCSTYDKKSLGVLNLRP